jgi:hypothetical protein
MKAGGVEESELFRICFDMVSVCVVVVDKSVECVRIFAIRRAWLCILKAFKDCAVCSATLFLCGFAEQALGVSVTKLCLRRTCSAGGQTHINWEWAPANWQLSPIRRIQNLGRQRFRTRRTWKSIAARRNLSEIRWTVGSLQWNLSKKIQKYSHEKVGLLSKNKSYFRVLYQCPLVTTMPLISVQNLESFRDNCWI